MITFRILPSASSSDPKSVELSRSLLELMVTSNSDMYNTAKSPIMSQLDTKYTPQFITVREVTPTPSDAKESTLGKAAIIAVIAIVLLCVVGCIVGYIKRYPPLFLRFACCFMCCRLCV
jgi:hypothetical protein